MLAYSRDKFFIIERIVTTTIEDSNAVILNPTFPLALQRRCPLRYNEQSDNYRATYDSKTKTVVFYLGVQQCFGVVYHESTTLRRVYFAKQTRLSVVNS